MSIKANFHDRTFVYAGAGIRNQLPPYFYFYNDYEYFYYKIITGGYFIPLANSALVPEKSTQVELGISHLFNPHIKISISGYLKWEKDQIQIYTLPSLPRSYATYRNYDQVDIKGLDVQLKLKDGKNTSFELLYSLCDVDGTGSYPSTQYNIAWVNTIAPSGTSPLDYDQGHKFAGILKLDFRWREKYNSRFQVLNELLFGAVVRYDSRLPYTPIEVTNEATLGAFAPIAIAETNSLRMPDRLSIDFHLERSLYFGKFQITPFVEAVNILDKKNVADVWNYSGLPNATGWLQSADGQQWIQANSSPDYTGLNGEQKYYIKEQLPQHYYAPRQFFFGVRATF